MSATITKTDDFVILGPTLSAGSNVLDAVHALIYLPHNFKLILTGADTADNSIYNKVCALVERDELSDRVEFASAPEQSDAVILPRPHYTHSLNSVAGNSPEALASAILNLARAFA